MKKFVEFMWVSLELFCPLMKYDISMLKKGLAEFCFFKDLVSKAANAHFAIH